LGAAGARPGGRYGGEIAFKIYSAEEQVAREGAMQAEEAERAKEMAERAAALKAALPLGLLGGAGPRGPSGAGSRAPHPMAGLLQGVVRPPGAVASANKDTA
jgi:hypothetical protein